MTCPDSLNAKVTLATFLIYSLILFLATFI
jgi:hypothetical protein